MSAEKPTEKEERHDDVLRESVHLASEVTADLVHYDRSGHGSSLNSAERAAKELVELIGKLKELARQVNP
jgi:hypothetical protein